jgi:hypothetical protein
MSFGSVDIVAAPKNRPPFPVDAVAFEEDTLLVLSSDPKVRDPHKHLMQVMTQVIETRAETPGSVLVKGKSPLRLIAIVHDLNQEPSWREEWIASALDGIFREAESRKIRSIALPFLGTLHGSLEKQRFPIIWSAFGWLYQLEPAPRSSKYSNLSHRNEDIIFPIMIEEALK